MSRCSAASPGSEDCLFLNVWRPRTAERGLPVYVWIHGGGNSIGSASMTDEYSGTRLAHRSNMVFVSLNYRLGPFGWFTHPALREGTSAEDDSGNFGTLDIVHALRWIRDNIEAFGGDPGLVAVTGESAGGLNVLSLMISPPAEGLFHRVIAQSPPWARVSRPREKSGPRPSLRGSSRTTVRRAAATRRAGLPRPCPPRRSGRTSARRATARSCAATPSRGSA